MSSEQRCQDFPHQAKRRYAQPEFSRGTKGYEEHQLSDLGRAQEFPHRRLGAGYIHRVRLRE